ncbi:hypothetical protein [Bailinhaonella thermotolerans]|uniref:Uncharacterized protein n=1 Tax=Bailinhaonella thermotolerans TaxID=1070861 RepID=A0A3A4AE54_9ACTN|nr:hypothetical protein [Bailinhaonella thermotolerans]RJL26579.1 hypothetical protein D5H75_26745 [Bailinhaonella thermotolerans]
MDPLTLVAGAVILAAGFAAGRLTRLRPRRAPKPRCGCGHDIAFHDGKDGSCHARVKRAVEFDQYGTAKRWEDTRCACRGYHGPEPLPRYYAPEIADGS